MTHCTEIASLPASQKIVVGRRVYYAAGYGGISDNGTIVKVHGEVHDHQHVQFPIGRIVHPKDVRFDVVLDDLRRATFSQTSLDHIGIGVYTRDEMVGLQTVAFQIHAAEEKRVADELAAKLAKEEFFKKEAARVITDAPIFYYNGIKDAKSEPLQKARYSMTTYEGGYHPVGTISITARDYSDFSNKVRACFVVNNNTDMMVDYFDKDSINVVPCHPLYAQVKAAYDKQEARRVTK